MTLARSAPPIAVCCCSQLRGLAVQKRLLGIQLVDRVAVKDPLRIDVLLGAADFADCSVDARPALQAGDEILHSLEDVGARAGKQLDPGRLVCTVKWLPTVTWFTSELPT